MDRPRQLLVDAGRITWHTAKSTLICSKVNVLLPCVALGVIAGQNDWDPAVVFTLNFLAMFPLASMLTFSTELLANDLGSTAGGLINASFGNAVEMLVGLSALREGEIAIVQSSMIGSILSSILLILGSSFLAVGTKSKEVAINKDVAGLLTSLLIISCASLIVPATLYATEPSSALDPDPGDNIPDNYILILSRATSIILLIFYVLCLIFKMRTHKELFKEEEPAESDHEIPPLASATVLILTTLAINSCSDYLVNSVDGLVETLGISRSFIGLIIVPIVGNASCFVATVQWSLDKRIDLSVTVIVESTLQISLLVTPFLVMMGWVWDKPMSLQFDRFETIVLTMSVLVVNCLVRDGSTNYFEGLLLIGTYLIIAIAFFVHPDAAPSGT